MFDDQFAFKVNRVNNKKQGCKPKSSLSRNNSQKQKDTKKILKAVKIDLNPKHNLTLKHDLTLSTTQHQDNSQQKYIISKLHQQLAQYKTQNNKLKDQNRQFKSNQEILNRQIAQLNRERVDQYAQDHYSKAITQQTIAKYREKIKILYQQLINQKKKTHRNRSRGTDRNIEIDRDINLNRQNLAENCKSEDIVEDLGYSKSINYSWDKIQKEKETFYHSSVDKSIKLRDNQYRRHLDESRRKYLQSDQDKHHSLYKFFENQI